MFEWMNRHKKNIMKYTLWLVIPSFVLMYGYGECMAPRQIRWVAKVNGERILETTWNQQYENLLQEMKQAEEESGRESDLSREELRKRALERAILSNLFAQKAEEWGIGTTDTEVVNSIREIPYFQNEQGQFDLNIYRQRLAQAGYHDVQFEEMQRDNITRSKIQSIISQTAFRAATEKERQKKQRSNKATIEYLAFEPSAFSDEVVPNEEEMKPFFEENKEDYRIPEQRRIAYARFDPNDFIQEATFTEPRLRRFFQQHQENYELPEQVMIEYLLYPADEFAGAAEVSEEEIVAHYEENQDKYTTEERARVRYIAQPLEAAVYQYDVTEEAIKQYYEKNKQRYQHNEQVKARHVLMQVTEETSPEQEEAIQERLMQVRQEILDGEMTFEEAAKEYSEGPTAPRGGDLGYFERGRMVEPFEEYAFNASVGEISEPVKTRFGYHLIKVEDSREEGTEPLEKVRDQIAETLKKEKANHHFSQLAESITSLNELSNEYEIQQTPWFTKGEEIPGIPSNDRMMFSYQAFGEDKINTIYKAGSMYTENIYLVEVRGYRPPRPMSLEAARDQVIQEVKEKKAIDVTRAIASEDMERIRSASVPLNVVAQERGLQVKKSELFSRDARSIPGLGSAPAVVSTAFTLEVNEIEGPLRTAEGYTIIRLLSRVPSRLPELNEVQREVERDFRKEQANRLARNNANMFIDKLYVEQLSISNTASSEEIEWGTTELFEEGSPIPGLGAKREINQEAFDLDEIGEITNRAIEERRQQQQQPPQQQQEAPIEGYYVIELLEVVKSHLPEFEDVREEVEEDYRWKLAEPLAVEAAEETLAAIKDLISASSPYDATRSVNLESFAEETSEEQVPGFNGPVEITGMGSVQGIGQAVPVVKTAFALEPGQVSNVVTNYRTKVVDNNKRVQGQMTGAYIIQLLDKKLDEEDEEEDPRSRSLQQQIDRYFEQQQQMRTVSAWIEEVSASADIEYNDEFFSPEEEGETQVQTTMAKTE